MRLIYSLRLDLECTAPSSTVQIIAPVDGGGDSRHCRPLNRKKRLVDLGPGEHVLLRGRVYRIQNVGPHRWRELTAEAPRWRNHTEGFVAAGDVV